MAGDVRRAGATETDREVPEKLTEGEKEAPLVLGLWDPKAGARTVCAELEDRPVGMRQPRKRLSAQQGHHTRDATSFQVLTRPFCQKPGCLGGSPAPAGLRNQSQGSHTWVLSEQPWPYHPSLTAALLPSGRHQMKTQGAKRRWHAHGPRGVWHLELWGRNDQSMMLNPSESRSLGVKGRYRTPASGFLDLGAAL